MQKHPIASVPRLANGGNFSSRNYVRAVEIIQGLHDGYVLELRQVTRFRSGIVICVLQASYPVLATDRKRRSAKPRLP